ncbi:MAG: cytochrome P450 [Thermohalobaculum sp.]
MQITPPRIAPPTRALSLFETLRAARRNVLEIIPGLSFVQPMVSGRLGSRWHMVQDPGALRRIFLDNVGNYPKSEIMLRMLRPAVGDSLFTSEGDAWRRQRRTVAPVFAQRNVTALAPVMTATAERTAERLARSGGRAEMVGEMLSATFDVICDVALSGREHFDVEAYGQAIVRYMETVGRASVLDFLHVPNWMPRPGAVLGRGSVRTMHAMVSRAIEERRRAIAGRAVAAGTGAADDLLDHMLKAEDAETGRRMTPEELLHNMQFFIVAGHETTALALSWSLLLLAGDPAAQERASAEARAALGDAPAGAGHIAATPYVGQVIEEALRLYPPVALLARNVRRPDLLAGRRVLPNDTLFLPIFALHRHRMWWDDPDVFDPGNFAPEKAAARDRYLYLPFGAGPRVCVGANFAMMQAHIILATLLARFRFAPGDGPPPVPTMSMTLRPEGGVRLTVTPL